MSKGAITPLASIRGSKGLVPAWAREVQPAETQCNLGALLAVALRRFALLDAGALGLAELPAQGGREGGSLIEGWEIGGGPREVEGGRWGRGVG